MRIRCWRTIKKTGECSEDSRYYLFSQDAGERQSEDWIHWSCVRGAGMEHRHHGRLEATRGEDGPRLRRPRALANLAFLRSVGLRLLAVDGGNDWLPALRERLATNLSALMRLIQTI